jgi:hypothetical protein
MKKILIFLCLALSFSINAQTVNSTADGEWSSVVQVSYNVIGGNTVNIQHVVESNGEINVLFGGTLNILSDSLIINAGLVTFIGGNVTINEGAVLWVNGDLDNTLWGDIIVNGSLKVDGDVSNWGSSVEVGENGYLGISGDLDNTGGTIENGVGGTINVGGVVSGVDPEDNVNEVTPDEALPITLKTFNAWRFNEYVYFQWVSESELNNDYYEILYSSDLKNWSSLAKINGAGNSNLPLEYNYKSKINNSYYYRLKQTDYDGKFEIFTQYTKLVGENTPEKYYIFTSDGKLVGYNYLNILEFKNKGLYIIKDKNNNTIKYIK